MFLIGERVVNVYEIDEPGEVLERVGWRGDLTYLVRLDSGGKVTWAEGDVTDAPAA